jgi:thiosulfate reductase cytochrome b subunit
MSSLTHQPSKRSASLQPLWLRITHWLNAVAVLIMVMSGWRIYNASPIFDFTFPKASPWVAGWAVRCNGTSQVCGCLCSTGWLICC